MRWERTQRRMLVANLGAYRGIVERTEDNRRWTARVEAPDQVYHAEVDYPATTDAQAWVEEQITALLGSPPSRSGPPGDPP